MINLFFTFILFRYMYIHKWLISASSLTENNFIYRLFTDLVGNCSFVILLLTPVVLKKCSIKKYGITNKSPIAISILFAIYFMLFIYHKDFTITGFYTFFYYFLLVSVPEEFIYRGYLFNKFYYKYNFWISVIISGTLFGIGHAILPTILKNEGLAYFMNHAISNILGQGILVSALFSGIFKKSENLIVPIIIHAILDYIGIVFK